MSSRVITPMKESESSPIVWKPEDWMLDAVKFLVMRQFSGLFLDPGMRKTSITLAALKILIKKGYVKRALIVAPRRVAHLVWPAEIQKWKDFNDIRYEIVHGKHKQEALDREADVYITTFETLEWLLGCDIKKSPKKGIPQISVPMRNWKQFGFDLLIIDELSKFKHGKSQRSKMIQEVLHTFPRRWGLTGSPAANGLMNLFNQMYVIDRGKALGQYITGYRNDFFERTGWGGYEYALKEGAEKKIYKSISKTVLRISAEDKIKLPAIVENPMKIELPDDARKAYDAMEKDFIIQMYDKVVTAANAATASGKLRQLASGAIYTEEYDDEGIKKKRQKGDWIEIHNEKIIAMRELIDEQEGKPILVGYEFQHDLERLLAEFGKNSPVMGGGTSDKKAMQLERAWNRGELPFLFAHPASMGHGLNLQESSNAVAWFTLTWDYELYDQFIKRVRRSGNIHSRVIVHMLLANNTVDEAVLAALGYKGRVQNALFHALQDYSAGILAELKAQRLPHAASKAGRRARY